MRDKNKGEFFFDPKGNFLKVSADYVEKLAMDIDGFQQVILKKFAMYTNGTVGQFFYLVCDKMLHLRKIFSKCKNEM